VQNITETVTTYQPVTTGISNIDAAKVVVYPNPSSEVLGIQVPGNTQQTWKVELIDLTGKKVMETKINPGSTIGYFDVRTVYDGQYTVVMKSENETITKSVVVAHE
jgi:hypothetical protein